ncbi:MAG: hypothetical protein HN348_13815 [Proteobacteria bacterium]|jgi:hypothetical protein|nr:hypothetical protein [Pseudomonadota bacterium]
MEPDTAPAQFKGSLSGRRTSTITGRVVRSGRTPYLLLGLDVDGEDWLLDLTGIASKGKVELKATLIDPMEFSHMGRFNANILALGKQRRIRNVNVQLKGSQRVLRLKGTFTWEMDDEPSEIEGYFSANFDGDELGAVEATLQPFNDGWEVRGMFMPAPGQGVTATLTFPAPVDGTWMGDFVSLEMTWAQVVNEDMSVQLAAADPLVVVSEVEDGRLLVEYEGRIIKPGEKGERVVKGYFEAE